MEYISVSEAAKKWEISERRVQKLCEENRIPGVERISRKWFISHPVDGIRSMIIYWRKMQ